MSTESAATPAQRIASGYAVKGQALELGERGSAAGSIEPMVELGNIVGCLNSLFNPRGQSTGKSVPQHAEQSIRFCCSLPLQNLQGLFHVPSLQGLRPRLAAPGRLREDQGQPAVVAPPAARAQAPLALEDL